MKPLRYLLISAIATLLTVDLALNALDPLGIKAYFHDLDTIYLHMTAHPTRGYTLQPGTLTFWHWQANIRPDATRLVPDTLAADCTLAFVGDSVTFGHGVNDGATFVNQLAVDAPGVQYVNAGVNGYNAAQVLATVRDMPANGYVYLLIDNDAQPAITPRPNVQGVSTIALYLTILTTPRYRQAPDYAAFDAAIAALKAMQNVVIVGLAGDPLAARAEVPTIARWVDVVSRIDPHPNERGHEQIAGQLRGYADALGVRAC